MARVVLIAAAVLVIVIIGGALGLMFWDIPAPSSRVEHVVPDAKLPR